MRGSTSGSTRFAEETCSFLAAAQLKAICRWRGFSPPGAARKAELARFVAPRLLEPTGVAEAMGSLDERWLVVLHRVAMGDQAPTLDELGPVVRPDLRPYRAYQVDFRAAFRSLADGLLSRGVVLVDDSLIRYMRPAGSRYERVRLVFPEEHRAQLPPFPVDVRSSSGKPPATRSTVDFCLKALRRAVQALGDAAPDKERRELSERVSAAFSFTDGELRLDKRVTGDVSDLRRHVRSLWLHPRSSDRRASGGTAREAADHVLRHLADGAGVTAATLARAIDRFGWKLTPKEALRFCEEGHEAGMLARWGRGPDAGYGARTGSGAGAGSGAEAGARAEAGSGGAAGSVARPKTEDPGSETPLRFSASAQGVRVDLSESGLGPLLELATVSRTTARDGRLELAPDPLRLGRRAGELAGLPVLRAVRAASSTYDSAARTVEERHGQLLLHEGLLILRIDDLAFRTLVQQKLEIRSLGGPYLAVPRGSTGAIEKLAKQEGFSPRRIS